MTAPGSKTLARALPLLIIIALVGAPGVARACPMCAADGGGDQGSTWLLGLFLIAPLVIAAIAAVFIARAARDRAGEGGDRR